jgi:8-oxo-dGTP pyrophosphatase MutT (NUDIX family)
MHRQPLLHLLESHTPVDNREWEMRDEILAFVRQNPDCFERVLTEGHITASAWITNPGRNRVLMTHHRKLDRWFQLGGHADGETDVLKAALSEAREESGLHDIRPLSERIFDVDVHVIPSHGDVAAHKHYDIRFLLEAAEDQPLKGSERESKQLRWVSLEEVVRLNSEASIRRMVEKMKGK